MTAQTKTRRVSAAEKIAYILGTDFAEMAEYRYQPTRYAIAVYAIGESYYCATSRAGKLPDVGLTWKAIGEAYGATVYEAKSAEIQ